MALATAHRNGSTYTRAAPTVRVAAYIRVSTNEQADSGAGLDAQTHAIQREAERRAWPTVCLYTDAGISGKSMDNRDALQEALALVEGRRGSVLVVAKLDRLTRSLRDFADLLERSRRRGWNLVALDFAGLDTGTPAGEMLANVVASVALYERRIIGARTKDAMAAKVRQGAKYGRRSGVSDEVRRDILERRESGETFAAIADRLNEEGISTSFGGRRWYPSTVRVVTMCSETN